MVEKQERPIGKVELLTVAACVVGMLLIIGVSAFIQVLPARAQSTPEYGKYPLFTFSSTVYTDEALVTAPAAGYRYILTDINYSVRTQAANDYIKFNAYAGTTVGAELFEISLEGVGDWHHFNPGIPLTSASGIWSDYTGSTTGGIAYVVLNGYIEGGL